MLRGAALLLDQGIDRMLELRGILLRGRERQLRLVFLIEFVGSGGNDPVVRADGAKLLVKGCQFFLLRAVGDCIQVFGYFPLGRGDNVAPWFQATSILYQRGL